MAALVDIMIIAGGSRNRLDPEIYGVIGFGQRLQKLRGGSMGVWILGEDIASAGRGIADLGIEVTVIENAGPGSYINETYGAVLEREIRTVKPVFVCAAHNSSGSEWAPAVAARSGAGCISGVDGLAASQGRICFQKDLYGGKVKGLFSSRSDTTVITVQAGAFTFVPSAGSSPGSVTRKRIGCRSERIRYLETRRAAVNASDITSAPIVVAVGNGIGDQDNMALIQRLAGLLPKAAVAGTRIICDRGWLGYDRQVGVTGAKVAPELYMACGISGAFQHVMGMREAKFVVAINTDPRAPIFNEADICIVEDLQQFIPFLENACERLLRESASRDEP